MIRQVLIALKAISFFLRPFMPETAQTLWLQLGQSDDIKSQAIKFFDHPEEVDLPAGQKIRRGEPIFPRK